MKRLLFILLMLMANFAQALPMLMARSAQDSETTMALVQEMLHQRGYQVAHVQKCDGGLAEFEYKTDFYRVVFFGKVEQVRQLTAKYPQLTPYLPLKIAVFAEGKETIVAAFNPIDLAVYFDDPKVQELLLQWATDIGSVFDQIQQSEAR